MMVELPSNPEFEKAWDELSFKLDDPNFNLDTYLTEKRKELSAETMQELCIALKLGKLLEISREYEKWAKEEDIIEEKRMKAKITLRRVIYWTVAAAAILLFGVILPTIKRTVQKPQPSIQRAEFIPMVNAEVLGDQIFNALKSLGILKESDLECNGKGFESLCNFSLLTKGGKIKYDLNKDGIMETMPTLNGNFKYADLDKDGRTEIVFAYNGCIICMDLNGQVKWHFQLSKDSLDADYIPKLMRTLKYKYFDSKYYPKGKEELEDERAGLPIHAIRYWSIYPAGDKFTLDNAWPLLMTQVSILKIMDFNSDGYNEVLVSLFGAIFVFNRDGQPLKFEIDGKTCKHITVLEGSNQDVPKGIDDIDGDGYPEFIVYRMPGYPRNAENGKTLYSIVEDWPVKNGYYVYKGEPFNGRGLYVASYLGKEKWHLNLPWHNYKTEVCDWDNDGNKEILVDSHIANNHYWVNYSDEYKKWVGYNFDWSSLDERNFPQIADDSYTAFLVFETMNGKGHLKFYKEFGEGGFNFVSSRSVGEKGKERIELIEYEGLQDQPSNWWYVPWIPENHDFKALNIGVGHPDLYHNPSTGLYGFDTVKGLRRVFGLCPLSQIKLTDDDYNEISTYTLNPNEIKDPDDPKKPITWDPENTDCVVFDVSDFDGDGTKEILAGFGNFHTDGTTGKYSVIRIFTEDLEPFHPELDLDRYVVKEQITDAGFRDVNGDGKLEIVIIADYPYFLTLQKK